MSEPKAIRSLNDIPGWFPWLDQRVFEHFLAPDAVVPVGDLVELGVYVGKSAALMGNFVAEGETFTVIDLFGNDSDDAANQRENDRYYSTLNRSAFEHNYLALHDSLPVVVENFSSAILDHVAPSTARFVHVDASHLYDHVVVDIESARTMLLPEAVVSLDDYRSQHTPGVAAAVWGRVASGDLHPICVTGQKFYGTFGDPAPHLERLRAWVGATPAVHGMDDSIAKTPILRLRNDPPKPKPEADLPALLRSVDTRLKHLEQGNKRLDKVEKAIRALPRPEPDFPTKLVRRLRAARRR